MTNFATTSPLTTVPDESFSSPPVVSPSARTQQVSEISSLLDSLDEVAAQSGQSLAEKRASAHENKLIQARLGMASGLYSALRAKHPPTASHCLRVALGCSSWAAAMKLDDETCDLLEVAALLHDVGKIGVPDKVLLKPGRLQPEEIVLMSRHAARTIEILVSCGARAATRAGIGRAVPVCGQPV
jgi:HD-GYP domain-containing protein (c-di-GMP phosphodiesterase class II)